MIVKILSAGKSFKGLGAYLSHDPKAESATRVGWTHTHNLANDHVPSAIDEMLWTARNAELLKQEAGLRAGGRATEKPVKHVSLNWAPDDEPTREHMIESAEDFLRHMKWQEHQAVFIAHEDKAFSHVHLMINVVHPENGLRLDDNFERRRAQAWALGYEREQGKIYCAQRLEKAEDRQDAPTRPAWMAFQEQEKQFERDENNRRAQEPILIAEPENPKNAEWAKLKKIQRRERVDFFLDGKTAFSELRLLIYREVREEFRERWSNYFTDLKNGGDADALATVKADLVRDQREVLDARRDEACEELRDSRDILYRELLDEQREARFGLRNRQEAGFEKTLFLELVERRQVDRTLAGMGEARDEITSHGRDDGSPSDLLWQPRSGMKSGEDAAAKLTEGIGFSLISFMESLCDGFVGSKPDPKPRLPPPEPSGPNPFQVAAEEAGRQQQREREEAEETYRRQQRSYGE